MERSSPSRTAGIVIREVTIGSETYTLSQPDKVRSAADAEAVIISRRQIPGGLSQDERMAAINFLVCGIASPQEWNSYYSSFWELAFRFWNALDPSDKEKALNRKVLPGDMKALIDGVKWAYEIVTNDDRTKEEMDNLWLGIRCVSQDDAIKNSPGSPKVEGTQQTETQATEATPPSTPGA